MSFFCIDFLKALESCGTDIVEGQLYRMGPREVGDPVNDFFRVIDGSGESYLYPCSLFEVHHAHGLTEL